MVFKISPNGHVWRDCELPTHRVPTKLLPIHSPSCGDDFRCLQWYEKITSRFRISVWSSKMVLGKIDFLRPSELLGKYDPWWASKKSVLPKTIFELQTLILKQEVIFSYHYKHLKSSPQLGEWFGDSFVAIRCVGRSQSHQTCPFGEILKMIPTWDPSVPWENSDFFWRFSTVFSTFRMAYRL